MKAFEDYDSESEMNVIEVGSPHAKHGDKLQSLDRQQLEFEKQQIADGYGSTNLFDNYGHKSSYRNSDDGRYKQDPTETSMANF